MSYESRILIAVDIGNSRMKLGRFASSPAKGPLAEPDKTCDVSIRHSSGEFDVGRLSAWSAEHVADGAEWRVASVHRQAAERLTQTISELSGRLGRQWPLRRLTYRDVPLAIDVESPDRVGIDRLLAAAAANRLRRADRAAIVVDAGTAITVDLVDVRGAFCGGAILPGIAMSARALEEQTDALPRVGVEHLAHPPSALGKATVPAIEAGLYWGAVGAIRELTRQLAAPYTLSPDVLLTGGASKDVAEILATNDELAVRYVPHLVLSGIALSES